MWKIVMKLWRKRMTLLQSFHKRRTSFRLTQTALKQKPVEGRLRKST